MTTAVAYLGRLPGYRTLVLGRPHTDRTIRCPRLPKGVTPEMVAEVLVAARSELRAPGRWTQNCLATFYGYEATGDPDFVRIMPRANVQSFCAMGAMLWVAFWARYPERVVEACVDVLRALLPNREQLEPWNDQAGRTQAEVIDLFSRGLVLVTRGEI